MESKIITTLDKHNEALKIAINDADKEAQIESTLETDGAIFQIKTVIKKLYAIEKTSIEEVKTI